MNITKKDIDALNAELTITVNKEDYAENVQKTLKQYRKTANVPGFRKGHVPMSYVKKQYEKPLIFDEVNKLLQTKLNDYITEEKLSILGNPLPKEQDNIDWDAEELNFDFELGLAPEFDLAMDNLKLESHKILVNDEEIDKYVSNFAKRYGSLKQLETPDETSNINGLLKDVDSDWEKQTTLFAERLKDWTIFKDKKIGDVVTFKSSDLYEKKQDLGFTLDKTEEELEGVDLNLSFEIKEISKIEPAAVDQALFDKVYGEGSVASEEEFRAKIKEESEKMYVAESDKALLNEALDDLLTNTQFDLPKDFLTRWVQFSNKEVESEEQAKEQFEKSEKGIRYQLIQTKIAEQYDIKVAYEDVLEETKQAIRNQMAMYGQQNMSDEDLQPIVDGALKNQEEYQRMADQVFANKLLNTVKEHAKIKEKEVTFEQFMDIITEKNKQANQ